MKIFRKFSSLISKIIDKDPNLKNFILNVYYRSVFYRKKHLRKGKYNWLKNINITNINETEYLLEYHDIQFILLKNKIKEIPLHQKYLYAALIGTIKIPTYFLLFWDDLVIFHEIFIDKLYEKKFEIKAGNVILDLGASRGWFACKISKLVGDNGKIVAIEPNPYNFKYLKKNLERNNIKNVIPLKIGVWSSKKEIKLSNQKYISTIDILLKNQHPNKHANYITIEVDTIDSIVSKLNLQSVNYIKMDIEGAEIEAVKGATRTLSDYEDIKLSIAAYHEISPGVQSFKVLVPILKEKGFHIIEDYLPLIFAWK